MPSACMTPARVWSNVVVSIVCLTTTKSVPERTTSDNVATARMRVTIDIRLNPASIVLFPPQCVVQCAGCASGVMGISHQPSAISLVLSRRAKRGQDGTPDGLKVEQPDRLVAAAQRPCDQRSIRL